MSAEVAVSWRSYLSGDDCKFRFACNTHLRYAAHQLAFLSLRRSHWARAYSRAYRKRGHDHHQALRALGIGI
jgi:hypothetical protein